MISFLSVLHTGNMKGDFGWDGLAGRQGCKHYSCLAEGGRLVGWVGCRLMFHLLFVPRYLDYELTDMEGALLSAVTENTFAFCCLSTSPPLLSQHILPPLFICQPHPSHPSWDMPSQAQIPASLFFRTSIFPSFHSLCSSITLSARSSVLQ